LLEPPRPLFWLPRIVINTVITRQADRRRHATVLDLVELRCRPRLSQSTGFVNLSIVQVSCRRWQVPGWRDRFNGRVPSSYGSSWRSRIPHRHSLFELSLHGMLLLWASNPPPFTALPSRNRRRHWYISRPLDSSHRVTPCRSPRRRVHGGYTFPSDIIAWVRMPRYPDMLL